METTNPRAVQYDVYTYPKGSCNVRITDSNGNEVFNRQVVSTGPTTAYLEINQTYKLSIAGNTSGVDFVSVTGGTTSGSGANWTIVADNQAGGSIGIRLL